jgi:hypothetical protein
MKAGQPEIEHLHQAVVPDHDVLRLDVAVRDADGVRGAQRTGHLPTDLGDGVHRQPLREQRAQRTTGDELLDDVGVARVRRADLVDDDDVRMVQGRRRTGLAQETLPRIALLRRPAVHQLDGDGPVQPRVPGAMNRAHPALTNDGFETVMAEAVLWIGGVANVNIHPATIGSRPIAGQCSRRPTTYVVDGGLVT